MIVELSENNEQMNRENFNRFFDLVKSGNAFSGVPFEFRNKEEIINLEDVKYYVEEIRKLDKLGYLPIFIIINTDYHYDTDFSNLVENICSNHANVFIRIVIKDDSNIENIRNVIENSMLSSKIVFEYTIENSDFDINKYISILFKYTLNNHMVLSLVPDKKYDYDLLSKSIEKTNKYRRKKTVALEFGCGFPSCMFSNEQLGDLFRTPMMGIDFFCKPKVIIKPNLDIHYCEHPKSFKLKLENIKSIKDLFEQMEIIREQREEYLYEECDTCWYNDKLCAGGCYLNQI